MANNFDINAFFEDAIENVSEDESESPLATAKQNVLLSSCGMTNFNPHYVYENRTDLSATINNAKAYKKENMKKNGTETAPGVCATSLLFFP